MKPSIKVLAKEAKQRMCEGQNPDNRSMLPEQIAEEERVYKEVCRLMTTAEVVTDPIAQAADPEKWRILTGVERERYVLCLSDTYLRMCDRFHQEQGAKKV